MQNGKRQRFMCEDDEFEVEGEDKMEVMDHGRIHVKEKHGMDASDSDLEKEIKMV